tara:strand:+ start:118 stop:324 length:207 start_codon:yes stop_codon:yes gene_type:complete
MSSVFIVHQWDGYDFTETLGVFTTREVAEVVMEAFQASDEGNWYSHFIREVPVQIEVPKDLPKKYLVD